MATTILWVAMLATTAGCQQQPSDTTEALTERNKALVRRWIEEGFNQRNLKVVDELFAERVAVNGQIVGRDGLKESMSRHLRGFPDLHVTIDDIVAEGRKVGIWYTVEGMHRGEFEAIAPTGNHVNWIGFDLFSIEGDKISEARFLSDFHGLLTQLGATVSLPRPPERARP
ncbi:MAG: ester cyclase [Gemmatimonadales bacterium]